MAKPPDPPPGLKAASPGEWMKVWARVRTTGQVKNVGWACAFFADYGDGASVRPGSEMLAAICSEASEKTIKNALKQIREWGLMWRYIEGSKQGRRGVSDTYRLTIPEDIFERVPMLTPDYRVPVDNPQEQVSSEHVLSEHVLSRPGTGVLTTPDEAGTGVLTTPHLTNNLYLATDLATSHAEHGPVAAPVAAKLSTGEPGTPIERAAWQAAQSRNGRMNGSA